MLRDASFTSFTRRPGPRWPLAEFATRLPLRLPAPRFGPVLLMALAAFSPPFLRGEESKDAQDKFEEIRKLFEQEKDLEPDKRVATVERLGTAPCGASVRFLVEIYKKETNPVLWMAASLALGKIGSVEAAKVLITVGLPLLEHHYGLEAVEAALKSKWAPDAEEWLVRNAISPRVRKNAKAHEAVIKGLSRLATKKRLAVLEHELLQAASGEIQVLILETLRPQASDEVAKTALKLLNSQSVEVQVAVYDLLDALQSRKYEKHFVSGLTNPHWELRAASLEALSRRNDPQVVKHAIRFLKDNDKRVQIAAVHALLKLGGEEVIEPLFRALDSTRGRVQDDIADALGRLTGKNFGTASAQWESWWAGNKGKGLTFKPMSAEEFSRLMEADQAMGGATVVYPIYHGMRVISDRVAFIIDSSESMGEPYVAREKPREEKQKERKDQGQTEVADPRTGKVKEKTAEKKLTRLDAAKKALLEVLQGLEDGRYLNIVRFDTFVVDFVASGLEGGETGKLVKLSPGVRKQARAFVEEARPGGQTNLSGALRAAFQYSELDTIYVLTDGLPTYGVADPEEFLNTIGRWNRRARIKINTIGIGLKPEETKLLRSLAEQNYGVFVDR